MVRGMEPHKTSQSPDDEGEWREDKAGKGPHEGSGKAGAWQGPDEEREWRGGGLQQERQEEERSGERGWGVANAGGQRQHGDGGQRGGDLDNQQLGGRDEKGDERRPDQR